MGDISIRGRQDWLRWSRSLDLNAASTWVLGFGLVLYLGLRGGGFDPVVAGTVGVIVWVIFAVGLALGLLPVRRPSKQAWLAGLLLTAFVAWTGFSLIWTDSSEKTAVELARTASYLGIFSICLLSRGRRGVRGIVASVGSAIVVITAVGLLSRLQPTLFPDSAETGRILTGEAGRLSFPVGYWNGLAALIAIAIPLMLHLASSARTTLVRSVATAAIPLLLLSSYFTLSRGGAIAAVVSVCVYYLLSGDRIAKLVPLLIGGLSGLVLILLSSSRDALDQGLTSSSAQAQGDEMTIFVLIVCTGAGLLRWGLSSEAISWRRPNWTQPTRAQSIAVLLSVLALGAAIFVVLGGPAATGDAWSEFKSPESPEKGSGRLETSSGNGRYQYWSSSLDQVETEPLTGTGSGTFEYWWARNGDRSGFVRDAHSLYFQTLGELGIIGFSLLAAFLIVLFTFGARQAIDAASRSRSQVAAAVAACAAFAVSAAFDWVWQLPVVVVSFLLLGAAILGTGSRTSRRSESSFLRPRLLLILIAIGAAVAISIPVLSTTYLRKSQDEARVGNIDAALTSAQHAESLLPQASSPLIQQALLLEIQGKTVGARSKAIDATRSDPDNWRTWLVLSGIEARAGLARPAINHYRTARSLNPRSQLFEESH